MKIRIGFTVFYFIFCLQTADFILSSIAYNNLKLVILAFIIWGLGSYVFIITDLGDPKCH